MKCFEVRYALNAWRRQRKIWEYVSSSGEWILGLFGLILKGLSAVCEYFKGLGIEWGYSIFNFGCRYVP